MLKATRMLGKAAEVLVKPVRVLMKSRDRARERDLLSEGETVHVEGVKSACRGRDYSIPARQSAS